MPLLKLVAAPSSAVRNVTGSGFMVFHGFSQALHSARCAITDVDFAPQQRITEASPIQIRTTLRWISNVKRLCEELLSVRVVHDWFQRSLSLLRSFCSDAPSLVIVFRCPMERHPRPGWRLAGRSR